MKAIQQLIEKRANVSAVNNNNQTALHAAAIYSAEKLIDRLLEHNSNLVNFVDANGQTPLHYALKNIFNYKGVSASAYSMKDITRFNPGNKYNSNQKEEYEKEGAVNKLIKIEPKLVMLTNSKG